MKNFSLPVFTQLDKQTKLLKVGSRQTAYAVHLFTALGGVCGLFGLYGAHLGSTLTAFWCMAVAVIIDSVDGTLARSVRVKEATPEFDGALLDDIVDYLNYSILPAFVLLTADMLPSGFNLIGAAAIVVSSAFQFSHTDAKTPDHYFKRFPSYWNIVVFYLSYLGPGSWLSLASVALCAVLSFVPFKYIYPSRLEYFSPNRWIRTAFLTATILWGAVTCGMLVTYPIINPTLLWLGLGYMAIYFALSLFRTVYPMRGAPGVHH